MTDSSPEAAATTTPRDTTFDRRMIDDLRRYRRAVPSDVVPVTLDELDALLAAADERDAYEREACAEPATREAEARARCCHCGGRIAVRKFRDGKNWMHSGGDPARVPIGYHPAEPTPAVLPACDCGSVDRHGDDIGEHGERCPYHLAVLRLTGIMPTAELDALCKRSLAAMARA